MKLNIKENLIYFIFQTKLLRINKNERTFVILNDTGANLCSNQATIMHVLTCINNTIICNNGYQSFAKYTFLSWDKNINFSRIILIDGNYDSRRAQV